MQENTDKGTFRSFGLSGTYIDVFFSIDYTMGI